MATVDGTPDRDRFVGGEEDDQYTGFGGDDYLVGGDGDDILYGDDQNLYGFHTGSADRLRGGVGRDVLVGGGGADWLEGGGGDDILFGGFAGDIQKNETGYGYGYSTIGDGGDDILDGGGGIDRAIVIYDRAAGVSIDIGDPDRVSAITSGGTQIGSIVGVEILQFFGADGVDRAVGGSLNDELVGRGGADALYGGAGDDRLSGGTGDDFLDGGDGFDIVDYEFTGVGGVSIDLRIADRPQNTGAFGRDTFVAIEGLLGTRFTDRFTGGEEANRFDDRLAGDDRFVGNGGDDDFLIFRDSAATASSVVILAGTGDDRALIIGSADYDDRLTFGGGDGEDRLAVSRLGRVVANMGAGDDVAQVDTGRGIYRLTLGEGSDGILLANPSGVTQGIRAITVTDFAAGEAGDRVDLSIWIVQALTRYTPGDNPFDSGHFQLRTMGADTILDVDRNGGGDRFAALIVFQNTAAAAFTADNFVGVFTTFDPLVASIAPGSDFLL